MDFWFKPWLQTGIPQIPQTQQKQSNVASVLPTQQMMSYSVQSDILEGVPNDKAQKILDFVKNSGKSKGDH